MNSPHSLLLTCIGMAVFVLSMLVGLASAETHQSLIQWCELHVTGPAGLILSIITVLAGICNFAVGENRSALATALLAATLTMLLPVIVPVQNSDATLLALLFIAVSVSYNLILAIINAGQFQDDYVTPESPSMLPTDKMKRLVVVD